MPRSIREWIDSEHPGAIVADGHDPAIVGVLLRPDFPPVVMYDGDRLIQNLVDGEGMEWLEAEEHATFNVFSAYVGRGTPVFVRLMGGVYA